MSQASRLMGGGNSGKKPIKRKVGTRAVLNGKPVMWDGKKWVPAKKYKSTSKQPNRLTALNTTPAKTKKSKKPKVSNIPPSEGTGKLAEQRLRYGRYQDGAITIKNGIRWKYDGKNNKWINLGSVKPTKVKPSPKPPRNPPKPPKRKVKPIPKPAETKPSRSAIHTYKEHGSDTHVGRYKTLKEHRAAVEAKKKEQSK